MAVMTEQVVGLPLASSKHRKWVVTDESPGTGHLLTIERHHAPPIGATYRQKGSLVSKDMFLYLFNYAEVI